MKPELMKDRILDKSVEHLVCDKFTGELMQLVWLEPDPDVAIGYWTIWFNRPLQYQREDGPGFNYGIVTHNDLLLSVQDGEMMSRSKDSGRFFFSGTYVDLIYELTELNPN